MNHFIILSQGFIEFLIKALGFCLYWGTFVPLLLYYTHKDC